MPACAMSRISRDVPVQLCEDLGSVQAEETYQCDAGGSIIAHLRNITAGYAQEYRLGRWSDAGEPLRPAKRARAIRV